MTFRELPSGDLAISDIPEGLAEMLRQAPKINENSGPEAEARLFPSPGSEDPTLIDDWKAHVQPGIYDLFLDARNTVLADLAAMKESGDSFELVIPRRRIPAWLNVLNQARLALAAIHNFSEKDMSRRNFRSIENSRDLARFQIDFFAAIQEWMLEVLDGEPGGE